jgi:type IV pilus assembly protein PilA
MISTLRKRLRNEEKGFTLIELLVVVIILGILTAIAIPSYLSFRGRANDAAAKANVRSIIPSIESFYADNDGTAGDPDATVGTTGYAGMTLALLQSTYDQALDVSKYTLTGVSSSTYCVSSVSGDKVWKKAGPAAPLATGACT